MTYCNNHNHKNGDTAWFRIHVSAFSSKKGKILINFHHHYIVCRVYKKKLFFFCLTLDDTDLNYAACSKIFNDVKFYFTLCILFEYAFTHTGRHEM